MQTDSNRSNNIKSMTGFGSGHAASTSFEISVEIKAVNHRFLEIFLKIPKIYSCFEHDIRKMISERSNRGKFDVTVNRTGEKGAFIEVAFDESLASNYYERLLKMKKMFDLKGDVTISDMLTLKDIIQPVEQQTAIQEEWPTIAAAVTRALDKLDEMRKAEGKALWDDIVSRLDQIRLISTEVQPLVGDIAIAAKDRLFKRIQELTGGLQLDQDRLMQEVAVIAEKSDVTEELTRMNSHLVQFVKFGDSGSPLGRKLDFLLQELNREINTLGAKAASTSISPRVVDMKSELEKIREQIQNIE